MTEIGEPVADDLLSNDEEDQSLYSCAWRCESGQQGNHKRNWHTCELSYPEGGTAERKDGYSSDWKKAKRVPWAKREGINPRRWPDAYHIGRHKKAPEYTYPEYATEGHHLISCDVFQESEYPALVFNALLMGYDINCADNGWHFPAHIVDIVAHNLQHHASQHNWSEPAPLKYDLDELVAPILANLEQQILMYCRIDRDGELESQKSIIVLLARFSGVIRRKLERWDWHLTKLAKMRLGEIRDYGINVSDVKHQGNDFLIAYQKGKQCKMIESNLSLAGFPNFEHYVAAAIEELDSGTNPNVPFSWWLSRRLYRERLGRAVGPNSPAAKGEVAS